ncbi:MAG: 16S rRNA (cytosine(967)-C(5))-methyltransferase RsmB, partial [Ruminococcus sp.]|nr:16S rRNA (cytosine(967)-C(5))-methyltransferase RsmB [Candidatus Apopatosoma intestinale]
MTAREAAFLSLQKVRGSGRYANIELSGSLDRFSLSDVEKTFYTALFYGVIEREITLDYLISQFSDRKIDDLDRDVRTILQIGLYQLAYMDKVPESAAVNESVKLARRFYARKNSEGFINAVLRSYLRGKESVVFPDPKKDFIRYLSVTYSLPEWMC